MFYLSVNFVFFQKWRDDTVEQQSKLARSDPPVLVTRTIFEKIQLIETETRILINKVKLWDQAMKAKSAQDATKNDTKKDKAGMLRQMKNTSYVANK